MIRESASHVMVDCRAVLETHDLRFDCGSLKGQTVQKLSVLSLVIIVIEPPSITFPGATSRECTVECPHCDRITTFERCSIDTVQRLCERFNCDENVYVF